MAVQPSAEPGPRQGPFVGLAAMVAGLVVVVDQLTKRWALGRLETSCGASADACIDLILGARFRLVFNHGAAFGQGQGYGSVLAVLALVICLLLVSIIWKTDSRLQTVLLSGVVGGAVGNVIDRFARSEEGLFAGAVVDFIDLGWWPVFNVADMAVVGGVAGMMVMAWLDGRSASAE